MSEPFVRLVSIVFAVVSSLSSLSAPAFAADSRSVVGAVDDAVSYFLAAPFAASLSSMDSLPGLVTELDDGIGYKFTGTPSWPTAPDSGFGWKAAVRMPAFGLYPLVVSTKPDNLPCSIHGKTLRRITAMIPEAKKQSPVLTGLWDHKMGGNNISSSFCSLKYLRAMWPGDRKNPTAPASSALRFPWRSE